MGIDQRAGGIAEASEGRASASANAALRFEEAYEGLRDVVEALERGALGLDEATDLLERGLALAQLCEGLIEGAELRVRRLVGEEDGTEPDGAGVASA